MTSASNVRRLLGIKPAALKAARAKLARFEKFCDLVVTDEGDPFKLEAWQRLVMLAFFAGFSEILIVIPKGNGKTTLLAALAVFHLLTHNYPEAYIGASTRNQAKVMYEEARRISQLHASWRKRLIPRPSTREIYVGRGAKDGFLQVLSSDRMTSDDSNEGKGVLEGLKPTLGLIDELHAHVNDAIYAAIQGALHKRNGQMITISTAGANMLSLLKRIRDTARNFRNRISKDRFTVARDGGFVMFEWALEPKDDREDFATVKLVNPSSFVTVKSLRALKRSPSMTDGRWARRHCNLWGFAEGKWMEARLWDACADGKLQIPAERPLILGYDHARSYDHAVLVALDPTGGLDLGATPVESWGEDIDEREWRGNVYPLKFFKPREQDGGQVPFWAIKEAIEDACEKYPVAAVGYDKLGGFAASAEDLADAGIPMVEVSMKSTVWGPLTAELGAAIRSGRLKHTGDETLREHVLAAETKDSEHGERLHGRVAGKVDGVIAMGIAWYVTFGTDALEETDTSVYQERDMIVLS